MKKKIIVVLTLALCLLLCVSLVACKKDKGNNEKPSTTPAPAEQVKDNTVALKEGVATSKTYDGKAIALSASDFTTNGDGAITFAYKAKGSEDDFNDVAPKNAGIYEVKVSVAATAEWKACETTVEYIINKYELAELYEKVHTKEYDGNAVILVGYKTFEGTDVNIVIYMKSKSVGAEIDRIQVPGLLKDNYTIDQSEIQAEIVAKTLSNLKLEIAEDDVKTELDEQTITREIAGVNGEKIIVELTFNPKDLVTEDALELSFDGKGGATCIIKFQTENPNYELDLTLGELILVKSTAA